MRRLSKLLAVSLIGVFAGVLLVICSVPNIGEHLQGTDKSQFVASCDISCHTHSQHSAESSLKRDVNEDDIDPTPPPFTWPTASLNISLLYIPLLVVSLWFGYRQQKILLTTHLRY